ncbi:MAG: pilus assembly protein TadG-related protein [Pseudomonadota bacterium]|nr:pilus assembly protein TadG-related protein [Pseudomonadota bacterium]
MRTSRRGNYAILLALLLVVLLGFVAMAVDWGAVAVARIQVQAAADAGALAATAAFDDEEAAAALAQEYAGRVIVNDRPVTVGYEEVQIGAWDGASFRPTDEEPNAIKVTAHADVAMTFTRLFGVDSVRVGASAGAGPTVTRRRAPDVVLALDVTGSMSSSEIAQERAAAQSFLDCVHSRSTGDSKLGIVLFTGVDTTQIGMTEVGTGYAQLSSAISRIRGCGTSGMPECTGTNPAAGQGAALTMLAAADTPDEVGQAIILMSDGEPNPDSICASRYYTGVGWRAELKSLCTALGKSGSTQRQPTLSDYGRWSDGYVSTSEERATDVYTVYYGTEASGIDYLEDHVAAYGGYSLQTPDAAGITDAFEDICVSYSTRAAGMLF